VKKKKEDKNKQYNSNKNTKQKAESRKQKAESRKQVSVV